MKKISSLALAGLVAVAAGCDGDGPVTPPRSDLTGAWSYAIRDLKVPNGLCELTGVTLTLAHGGGELSGRLDTDGAEMECTYAGDEPDWSPDFGGGEVTGTVSGSSVTLDEVLRDGEGDVVFHRVSTGTLRGDVLEGTVTITQGEGAATRTLTGKFRAEWGS